jgi:hypothetical protein
MKIHYKVIILFFLIWFVSCKTHEDKSATKVNISGVYPHLACYNNEAECGTGAVVPWAGSLWVITYGPHLPFGSSDKLYQVTPELQQVVRPESIGGTPAARMIHKETNRLFIGSYAIDGKGAVRVISLEKAPGRYTGYARHLFQPESKLYIGTMEEGFYEVDVNSLQTTMLYQDGNVKTRPGDVSESNHPNALLPGAHGKGLYSGQGVLIYSNNGETGEEALRKFDVESGSLCEWDGKEWQLVRRNQFTEVTGPGGICGNPNPATDPIWVNGWDHKSVLLGVRDQGKWSFFRLPKASCSYDGAHGWNTEWPRIRDIGVAGQPDYLMTMHGMFWQFPGTFTASNTAGVRPRSAYLKVIGDFTRWNDQLVFGCDDSAQREFLNKRKAKGGIEGPGQSNSNIWFTPVDQPGKLGPRQASGYVWLNEVVPANTASEPFLFAGWDTLSAWVKNGGRQPVEFRFEADTKGTNQWSELKKVRIGAGEAKLVEFGKTEQGEWVRASVDKATTASLAFVYGVNDSRSLRPDAIFDGISSIDNKSSVGGLLYGLGDNRRALGLLANTESGESGYYEIDDQMNIVAKDDETMTSFIREKFAIPQQAVDVEKGSVLIVDDKGRRWRLPLGNDNYTDAIRRATLRICREVATERDLFNCHGTFYELPAENADGYAKIRPIASHNFRINDYASYRGLLVMTGIDPALSSDNPHIFVSKDRKAAVWAGVIDDLWKLGKPVGKGGPWVDTDVKAGTASDPYLIGFYDRRSLELSHQSAGNVTFTIEVDPTGDGDWVQYAQFVVKQGEKFKHLFPQSFLARWVRIVSDKNTTVTAWFEYL